MAGDAKRGNMKVVILTTSTGQGHNHAARALAEEFTARGVETRVCDVLDMGGRNASAASSRSYSRAVTYVPHIFYAFYRLGGLVDSPTRHSPVYYANAIHAKDVLRELLAFAPDAIVTTHMYGAQVLTRLAEREGYAPPTLGVMTDYLPSPLWAETRLTRYVVPAPSLTEAYARYGLPEEKLEPLGIPVSARFRLKGDPGAARAAFGLREGPVFAVLGGSMGFGRFELICRALHASVPQAQIVAVCGSNRHAMRAAARVPGVVTRGTIDNVDELMDAADVLLTKPGGLTTAEALNKGVPLVLTQPIPGGEKENEQFLASRGLAVAAGTAREAAKAAQALLRGEGSAGMLEAQRAFTADNAAAAICDLVERLAQGAGAPDCAQAAGKA